MKNLKRVLALSLLVISILGCSKDDNSLTEENQAKIIGTWKLTSSSTNNVADTLDACDLLTTHIITSNQITSNYYWGENCIETDSYTINYSIDGNTITTTDAGDSYTSEITTLNATTLSIKDEDDGDVYIQTYTKQ